MDLNALIADVFQQLMVDAKDTITVRTNGQRVESRVELMPTRNLRRVRIPLANGRSLVAVEQNLWKSTVWGKAALDGHKVMQVAENGGPYIGVVVDGKFGRYTDISDENKFIAEATGRTRA